MEVALERQRRKNMERELTKLMRKRDKLCRRNGVVYLQLPGCSDDVRYGLRYRNVRSHGVSAASNRGVVTVRVRLGH